MKHFTMLFYSALASLVITMFKCGIDAFLHIGVTVSQAVTTFIAATSFLFFIATMPVKRIDDESSAE